MKLVFNSKFIKDFAVLKIFGECFCNLNEDVLTRFFFQLHYFKSKI